MILILCSQVKLSSLKIIPQEWAAPLSSLNSLLQSVSFRTAPVRPNKTYVIKQLCVVLCCSHAAQREVLYSPAAEDTGGSMPATDPLPPSDSTPNNCYSSKVTYHKPSSKETQSMNSLTIRFLTANTLNWSSVSLRHFLVTVVSPLPQHMFHGGTGANLSTKNGKDLKLISSLTRCSLYQDSGMAHVFQFGDVHCQLTQQHKASLSKLLWTLL